MMRFTPPRCPECNSPPKGTLETVEGIAHVVVREDDSADYDGWTEILWNTQTTVHDAQRRVTLIGECDHAWQAEMANEGAGETPADKCDCESPGFADEDDGEEGQDDA